MKEWGIIIGVALVVYFIDRAINQLGKALDELHEKVHVLQERLNEIETSIEDQQIKRNYVNPIDIDRRI